MKWVYTFKTGRHKRQADITLLFQYISRKSNFASFFLSVHCKIRYSNWNALRKTVFGDLYISKAQISLWIRAVSSLTLLSAFWKSNLDSLRAELQFSCWPVKPRRLVCDWLCRKPRWQFFSRGGLIYFCCFLDSSRTNITSATDNNI